MDDFQFEYDQKKKTRLKKGPIYMSAKQAEEDACRIEHIISDETQQCIQNFLKKQS